MGCSSCAARRAKNAESYRWTSADGTESTVYTGRYAEVQASAKVKRRGGSFAPQPATPSAPE